MPKPIFFSLHRSRRCSHRAGFTMIELLVVVGIVVLLSGLVLAGVLAARKHAYVIRGKSDLQLIGTALEAYKGDFDGRYPVFADPVTDYNAENANPPIPGGWQWLDYSTAYNSQNAGARGAVLLCRALIGPGAAATNTNNPTVANPGDDGADGSGFRVRRTYNSTTGQFSGKVYGPYIDSSKFKIGYFMNTSTTPPTPIMYLPMILDNSGNPILYYPAAPGNQPNNLPYYDPTTATASSPNAISPFNGYDNEYYLDAKLTTSPFEKLSGGNWSSTPIQNPTWGSPPYLLWTAGADGVFGFDSKGKSDDIANFDLPGQYQK